MIKPFEFYFDFASPYTFIAHKKIRKIEKENSIKMKYMPILLGGLLKITGIKPNVDVPIKAKYMIKDCKLWAEKYNIEFKFNNFFPIITLNLMRGVLVAERENFSENYINKVFDGIWKEGINLNDTSESEKLLKNLKIDTKVFFMKVSDQQTKDELRKRTENAHKKGIFGVPTFIVDNKLFWGQDRLEFVLIAASK